MCRKLQDHLSTTSNCEDDDCHDEHDSAKVKRQRYKDQRRLLGEEDAGDEGPDSPKGEAEDDVHYGEHNGNGPAESGVDECSAITAGEENGAALESASEDGEEETDDEESEEEELLVETVAEFFERLVRERAEQQQAVGLVSERSSTVNNREEQAAAVLLVTMDENCNQLVATVRRREKQLQGSVRQSFIECSVDGDGTADDQIDAAMLLSESCDCGGMGELEGHEEEEVEEGTVRVALYNYYGEPRAIKRWLRSVALVRVIVWDECPGLCWA